MGEAAFAAARAALGARFAQRAAQRLARLGELADELAAVSAPALDAAGGPAGELRRLLHELAGGGAMFGFDALAAQAARLERRLLLEGPDAAQFATELKAALPAMAALLQAPGTAATG